MSSSEGDLPEEVENVDVSVPDLFGEVGSKAEVLQDDIERLDEIQQELKEITPGDIDEVKQVAAHVDSLRGDAIEAETLDEIESVYQEIKQAIASPYIQQAKTSYRSICSELGLTIDDETDKEIVTNYENTAGDEIEAKANRLSAVETTIAEFDQETKTSLATAIEGSEKSYFQLPAEQLEPLVADYESRETALKEVASAAKQEGKWATPLETLLQTEQAYEDLDADFEPETVTDYLEEIDFGSVADDVPVEEVVAKQLREEVDTNGIVGLTEELNAILDTPIVDDYVDSISALLTHEETNTEQREAELASRYTAVTTVEDEAAIEDLNDKLKSLNGAFETWAEDMASHIRAAIKIYGEVATDESESETFDWTGEEIPLDPDVDKDAVMTWPIATLKLSVAFNEWLSDQGTEGTEEGVTVDTLQKLVQGGGVSANTISGETVEQLGELLGENIRVVYQQRDDE